MIDERKRNIFATGCKKRGLNVAIDEVEIH